MISLSVCRLCHSPAVVTLPPGPKALGRRFVRCDGTMLFNELKLMGERKIAVGT